LKVLLAFVFIVAIGAMWETGHKRSLRTWPLLGLCLFVAVVFFKVSRVL